MKSIFLSLILAGTTQAGLLQSNPFYPMDTAFWHANLSIEQQAELTAELGFDGIGVAQRTCPDPGKLFPAMETNNLKRVVTYMTLPVTDGIPTLPPEFESFCQAADGQPALIQLAVRSMDKKIRTAETDRQLLEKLHEAADIAERHHLRIALYPHRNFYLASFAETTAFARTVARNNVGVTFNLFHWQVEGGKNRALLNQELAVASDILFSVTINGSIAMEAPLPETKPTKAMILPLNEGAFDTRHLLKTLDGIGYTGPIGLQCFGIRQPLHDHLGRSVQTYRKLVNGEE